MSPTVAEFAVGVVVVVLVFLLALQLIPLVVQLIARYINRSLDDEPVEQNYERKEDRHGR